MEAEGWTASLAATMIFALTFIFGRHIYPLRSLVRDRRSLISFSAGVSSAYLFIGMMPELGEAAARVEAAGLAGHIGKTLVYLMALLGFSVFYALDHGTLLAREVREGPGAESSEGRVYGFGLYVLLLTYTLAADEGTSPKGVIWYAIGMSFHFLAIDHSMRESRGEHFDRFGRYVLAVACAVGWALAQILEVSAVALSLVWGFVSGAVIVNSAIMELPEGRQGRLIPFLFGGLLYGIILILAAKSP